VAVDSDYEWRRRRRVILAIGPTWVYLILAVLLLTVLGGGTYLAYRSERRRRPKQASTVVTPGPDRAENEKP
jgi:hypothetical protein